MDSKIECRDLDKFYLMKATLIIIYFSTSAGVRDENNRAYNPKIVRIGLKAHHSVQAVSMDYLVCLSDVCCAIFILSRTKCYLAFLGVGMMIL